MIPVLALTAGITSKLRFFGEALKTGEEMNW
jgi:hypothetical protein